jgi:hypothetical protein
MTSRKLIFIVAAGVFLGITAYTLPREVASWLREKQAKEEKERKERHEKWSRLLDHKTLFEKDDIQEMSAYKEMLNELGEEKMLLEEREEILAKLKVFEDFTPSFKRNYQQQIDRDRRTLETELDRVNTTLRVRYHLSF